MKIIQSQFQNKCGLCGDRIEVGQDISPLQKRWYHTECVRGQEEARHQPSRRERIEKMDEPKPDGLDLAKWQIARYTIRNPPHLHVDDDLLAEIYRVDLSQ